MRSIIQSSKITDIHRIKTLPLSSTKTLRLSNSERGSCQYVRISRRTQASRSETSSWWNFLRLKASQLRCWRILITPSWMDSRSWILFWLRLIRLVSRITLRNTQPRIFRLRRSSLCRIRQIIKPQIWEPNSHQLVQGSKQENHLPSIGNQTLPFWMEGRDLSPTISHLRNTQPSQMISIWMDLSTILRMEDSRIQDQWEWEPRVLRVRSINKTRRDHPVSRTRNYPGEGKTVLNMISIRKH